MTTVLRHNIVGKPYAAPVTLDRRRRRLSVVVKRHAPKDRPFIVSVHRRGQIRRPTDETVRLRATWARTLIGADDVVVITQLPRGPGNSGAAIGATLALAALAIALPFALPIIAPAIFVEGFLTAAATAGIVLGAGYALGKVLQPKAAAPQDANRPLYGVSGGGNLPRPGDRIPVCYGHFWSQPDLTQPDFSIYDGDDMVLYKRHTLTLGKCQVHKIMLGAATLWTEADGVVPPFNGAVGGVNPGDIGRGLGGGAGASFGGTQVEIINPGGTSSLVPASVFSSPSVGGSELARNGGAPPFTGPFRASPVGKQTSRIQIDWSAPQGASHGDAAAPFGVLFQYAPCDVDDQPTGAWQTLFDFSATVHTTQAYRFTNIVDLAAGDYIVRAQNTQPLIDGVINPATWDGLRSHYPETIVRPHVTEIALAIRSGKNLGVTAFGDIWVEATRILPAWNGSAWVDAPTRKAVYAFKDILQADYGGQLADNQVDLDRIKFYAAALSEFDTFDGVIRGPVSLWEACASTLGPMRAEPMRIASTWSLERDEPRAIKKHVVTRRQIVRGSSAQSFKIARDDGAADVIVEYAPDGDPRRRRDIRVTFGAQSLTPNRAQLVGVSDHAHAHHIATWKAAAAYFRRERRKLTLDRRGRLIQRGDPALIDTWFADNGRTGGVLGRSGNTLTLDTKVNADNTTYATLRDRKGQLWGPVKATAGVTANVIALDAGDVTAIETDTGVTLANCLATDAEEMTTVLVGPLIEQQDGYLIESVTPQGRDRVSIEAVYDHQGVWDALGEAAPAAPPIPSIDDIANPATSVLPWVRARCVQKGVALTMEWAVGPARNVSANVVRLSYDDGASWESVNNDLSTSGSYPLRHVEGANVKVGAWAVNRFGVPGPAVYTTFTTFKPAVNSDTADLDVGLAGIPAELRGALARVVGRVSDLENFLGGVVGRHEVATATALIEKAQQIGVAKTDIIRHTEEIADNSGRLTIVEGFVVGPDSVLVRLTTDLDAAMSGDVNSFHGRVTLASSVHQDFLAFAGPDGTYAVDQTALTSALTGASDTYGGQVTLLSTLNDSFVTFAGPGGTYATRDTELASSITGVSDRLGGTLTLAASVRDDFSTFAGPGGTYATRDSELKAALTGASATIDGTQTVAADVDGRVGALWGLKVETDLHGRKVAATIKAGSDGTESFIYLKADSFAFALDGYDDTVALIEGTIDGVPTLGWPGRLMIDGEVYITKTAHLADAVIANKKIGDNEITSSVFLQPGSDIAFNSAGIFTAFEGDVTFTGVAGRPVTIDVLGPINIQASTGGTAIFQLNVDITTLSQNVLSVTTTLSGGATQQWTAARGASLTATGSPQTVHVKVTVIVTTGSTAFFLTRAGTGLEVKAGMR